MAAGHFIIKRQWRMAVWRRMLKHDGNAWLRRAGNGLSRRDGVFLMLTKRLHFGIVPTFSAAIRGGIGVTVAYRRFGRGVNISNVSSSDAQ